MKRMYVIYCWQNLSCYWLGLFCVTVTLRMTTRWRRHEVVARLQSRQRQLPSLTTSLTLTATLKRRQNRESAQRLLQAKTKPSIIIINNSTTTYNNNDDYNYLVSWLSITICFVTESFREIIIVRAIMISWNDSVTKQIVIDNHDTK